MLNVVKSTWALLLGMFLLMLGNGMQSTLVGIRGDIEGFSTFYLSLVSSGYFVGFLFGSRLAPEMIRRVGHVRVFAALGSLVSSVVLLFPTLTDPFIWFAGRVVVGFCFSGIYVTSESWLNDSADNQNRGQALSLYLIVQVLGLFVAQYMLILGDPAGFILFIIPSVLISLSFAPILLSISPTPAFSSSKPLSLKEIMKISPLGCVGVFLLGGVFAAQFGMAPVYGREAGLSVVQISTMVSMFFISPLLVQFPLGWLSDRMDRRVLILACSVISGLGAFLGFVLGQGQYTIILIATLIIGGMSNPLYSLLIAYTNDFLDHDDMAGAAGGIVFINGLGAVIGSFATGWMMSLIGPSGYFLFIAFLSFGLALYAAYRSTQRAAPTVEETESFSMVAPAASPMVIEIAQEVAAENAAEEENQ